MGTEERSGVGSVNTHRRVWAAILTISTLMYVIFLVVEPVGLRRLLVASLAFIQAALGVGYFMHLKFERLSLVYAILLPLILLGFLIVFAVGEGSYVHGVRQWFFGP